MTAGLSELADLDRLIHEPARLLIMSVLYTSEQADFTYLLTETGLTRGNLSSHLSRLEEAGYIVVEKTFRGKIPRTLCKLTDRGKTAFETYRTRLKELSSRL
jgi:DNA-binding MarR family transcriptional regulator